VKIWKVGEISASVCLIFITMLSCATIYNTG
jgi:hypothetical protein